jgi:hypothetical protein
MSITFPFAAVRFAVTAGMVALLSSIHCFGGDLDGLKSAQERFETAYSTRDVDSEVAEIDLRRDKFHGDWNYTLHPGKP